MYKVFLERAAEKDLNRLSNEVHGRVIAAIKNLSSNPRPANCRKLSGSTNDWRIRVGDYRIVRVNRIRHRREVYRWFNRIQKRHELNDGERTRLACSFRRLAKNFVPLIFRRFNF